MFGTISEVVMMSDMENNLTAEFILLGFQGGQSLRMFLFLLLLGVNCGTLCGNLLIITLVSINKNLHTPMYFFISQLSINDILLTTNIVPKMLHLLLYNGGTISFIGCMTQLYFFCASEVFECFLLTVMSYDRYVAICNPLRYTSIMTGEYCVKLSIICCTILNIRSINGRQKAFTTCSSHLIVVSIFLDFKLYVFNSVIQSKIVSLFYTVVTPLINPIIYCLRNKDIKEALKKYTFVLTITAHKLGKKTQVHQVRPIIPYLSSRSQNWC
ncbi:olfactory receptor 8B12-like [Rhinoderma darwinii]|uniref:olfactory receptor 8B12-like n=1 Tax=Rhinoderma darwinii TaxID=43563 RepID=UPI003F680891